MVYGVPILGTRQFQKDLVEDIDIVADMYFEELKYNDAGMYIFRS